MDKLAALIILLAIAMVIYLFNPSGQSQKDKIHNINKEQPTIIQPNTANK